MSKILTDYMTLLLSQIARFILSLLSLALLVRLLGPQDYGEWAMIIAAATFFHSFFLNWTQLPFVRFGKEEWEKTGKLNTILAGRWPLIATGFLGSFLILFYQPFGFLNKIFLIPHDGWVLVFLYLIGLWLSTEVQSIYQIKQAFHKLAINQLLIVVILILFYWSLNKQLFVLSNSRIMTGITIILLSFWLGMGVREAYKIKLKWPFPDHVAIKKVFAYGWTLIPTFLIGYLSAWGDHLMLGYFLSSVEVGLFHASFQIIMAMIGLGYPLTTVLLPHLLTQILADPAALKSYLEEIVPSVFVLWGLAVIPLMFLLPDIFLLLMGREYEEAVTVLSILQFAIPGACLSSLLTVLFSIQGRLHRPMIISAIMALTNIGISLLLIPRLGILGAGIGTASSYVVGQSLYLWDQARYSKINSNKIWFVFLCFLLAAFLQVILVNSFLIKIFTMILFISAYIFVVRSLKVLTSSFLEELTTSRHNKLVAVLKMIFITD